MSETTYQAAREALGSCCINLGHLEASLPDYPGFAESLKSHNPTVRTMLDDLIIIAHFLEEHK